MRYDDEYDDDDLPPRRRAGGVSAGWRVAAILCGVFAGVLALLLVGAAAALLERATSVPPPPQARPAPFVPHQQVPPVVVPPNDDDPDKGAPDKLPYPLVQDLRPPGALPTVPGEPPLKPEPSPREQLLAAGKVVWANDEPSPPQVVLVSPDGKSIAYAGSQGVMVGPPGDPVVIAGSEPKAAPPRGARTPATEPAGTLAWSAGGTALTWAAPDGRVGIIPAAEPRVQEVAGARARWAAAVPPQDEQLVLVREMARPKVEAPLRFSPADPSEVVVFDRKKKAMHVLIPLGTAVWRSPAVSPDGKRLALISDSGREGEVPALWRVFVIDLAGGVPKPLTPAAMRCRSVCWAPDGKFLVYDRSPAPDEEGLAGDFYRGNLFEVDPATGRETPLTAGGDFSSPSLTTAGELYCLAHARQGAAERVELVHLPRDKARELAAKSRPTRHGPKAWAALAASVLEHAGLPADAHESSLDEAKVKKLAAAFADQYRKQFKGEPPDTAAGLDRLRGEAHGVSLSLAERRRIALVLGAVEGDYLCRKHGARWVLSKPAGPELTDVKAHELFRHVVNPFRDFWASDFADPDDEERGFATLAAALGGAEGRPIVLAHDPAVRAHLASADPDLARGTALLKDGQGDEADRVLLEMVKRHAGNYHLALHVGALMSEQGRAAALRTLVAGLKPDELKDARVYNLVGVSRLDDDPKSAAGAFRNALRCNLYHGPAYFNLALAYEKLGDVTSARLCLRRYLKLLAYAPLADDARRRLAELPP